MTTNLTKKKITIAHGFNKSQRSMNGKIIKSEDELVSIEAEYIKSLQRQIYFLELEITYFREQVMKATGMHPEIIQEAENMLSKLKKMQYELERMNLAMKNYDTKIQVLISEKERSEELLILEKENHQKEKTLMTEELVIMRKEADRLNSELSCKNDQIIDIKSEFDRTEIQVNKTDMKINSLKIQLEQCIEQHDIAQIAMEEKQTQVLTVEAQLREMEDKYVFDAFSVNDKVHEDLRDEICTLHQKLRQTELEAEKNRFLRDKTLEDITKIALENFSLSQQLTELSKQLDKEREVRDSACQHYSKSLTEVAAMKEKLAECNILKNQLEKEQDKSKHYWMQLTNKKASSEEHKQQINTLTTSLSESNDKQMKTGSDNSQLRNEKFLLVDQVAELNKKIDDKNREILSLMASAKDMESSLRSVDLHKSLELTKHSQNWQQFSNLADGMKSLAHSMMAQASESVKSSGQTVPQY